MASDTQKDEMISLEDLVGEMQSEAKPGGDPAAEAGARERSDGEKDAGVDTSKVADIDNLLELEDPTFTSSMKDLQKQGAQATIDTDIDPLDLESLAKEEVPGRLRTFLLWGFHWLLRSRDKARPGRNSIFAGLKALPGLLLVAVRFTATFLKAMLLGLLGFVRKAVASFGDLPLKSKAVVFVALGFGALAVVTMKLTLGRQLGFGFGQNFLRSFAEVADAKYTYKNDEPIDNFTDPLFHPEHVILLDRFVINLRRPQDGSNPMGLFEFYLEASNQDCAVELKTRAGEVRDVISRTIEQMPYHEMVTVEGKEKLKVAIRKNVNAIVTRGQVRRVFYKTVVLKP